ncbi:solute carrier family 41 member 1-like isoform X1, partial [Brachionus plicatilis]
MPKNSVFQLNDGSNRINPSTELVLGAQECEINRTESETQLIELIEEHNHEKWYHTLLQIVIPFIIAGFGMVAAGVLLDEVQDWELFINLEEVIILVPALLGLKGNLEMTLASRLSTHVNLKEVNDWHTTKKAVIGNIALTQIQSIVVGLLASFIASITEFLGDKTFNFQNILILIVSSVSTASLASLFLGLIIMFIIILSSKFKINPDNIATPIAASLGDVVTLGILSSIGTLFYQYRNLIYIHCVIIAIYILLIPFLAKYCYGNSFVNETLYKGWTPVIIAMVISSIAGIILEVAIKYYSGVAIYQPVVNGVGGNIVGIFASRLGTSLHKTGNKGRWAHWAPQKYYLYPYDAFFSLTNPEHKTGLVLLGLTLPGHTLFFFVIYLIKSQDLIPQLV